jgi:hypothetical protein
MFSSPTRLKNNLFLLFNSAPYPANLMFSSWFEKGKWQGPKLIESIELN